MKDKAVIYLKQIEEAIEKYVFEHLVNIKEMLPRTQNLSLKEIKIELWQIKPLINDSLNIFQSNKCKYFNLYFKYTRIFNSIKLR